MKSIIFLVFLVSALEAFKVDNKITVGNNVRNADPFSPGTKKIIFNLDVTNGKAVIRVISQQDYELYKNRLPYKRYDVISDQPFSTLHTETQFVKFTENFYIVIENNNLLEDIYVRGEVAVIEPTVSGLLYILTGTVGGVILLIGLAAFIIYKCCSIRCPVCCGRNRQTVSYVPMVVHTTISE